MSKLKTNSVSGRNPTTTNLKQGELGANTADGLLFINNGVGIDKFESTKAVSAVQSGDLNNFVSENTNIFVSSIVSNTPTSNAFLLNITVGDVSSGTRVTQTATDYTNNLKYFRSRNSSLVWSSWEKITTEAELNTVTNSLNDLSSSIGASSTNKANSYYSGTSNTTLDVTNHGESCYVTFSGTLNNGLISIPTRSKGDIVKLQIHEPVGTVRVKSLGGNVLYLGNTVTTSDEITVSKSCTLIFKFISTTSFLSIQS